MDLGLCWSQQATTSSSLLPSRSFPVLGTWLGLPLILGLHHPPVCTLASTIALDLAEHPDQSWGIGGEAGENEF